MADSSRNIVLALLVVGAAIAVFYMMDPTFGGLLGKRETFQNAMANSMNMNMGMPSQGNAQAILPMNVPGSVSGMQVEKFQDNQQNNVNALLGAQDALVKALNNASKEKGSTTGFMNQKKNNESFASMKAKNEYFKGANGDLEGFQTDSAPSMGQPTPAMMNQMATASSMGQPMPAMMNQMATAPSPSMSMEGFQNPSSTPFPEATQPANCYPKNQLSPQELLPSDPNTKWAAVNPQGSGDIGGKNFLSAGALIGVNTVGQSMRNANQQLRSEPPCPQAQVSIWNQSTIEPDLQRRPLEGF